MTAEGFGLRLDINQYMIGFFMACASRLPLGVPSCLTARAMELTRSLIKKPVSQEPASQGVEREAGYIVISALCVSMPINTINVSFQTCNLSGHMPFGCFS